MTPLDDVRSYYDANSARFERYGQGGGTLHRAVWGPSVTARDEAFRYVDCMILREIEALSERIREPLHILDLGCGVGSSLLFLASHADIRATGVTLSHEQARRAREHGRGAGAAERVRFVAENYLELPSSVPRAHCAFSIEAFIHGPDPRAYFEAAARYLVPGGLLVVCDDFVTAQGERVLPDSSRRFLHEVRKGWLANTLVSADKADALARRAGFRCEKDVDLTPYLELRRPRDRAVSLLVAIGRHLRLRGPTWKSFVGGDALQRALEERLLEYRFVVWRRAV